MCRYWIFYFTDSTKATQYIIHLYTFYTCHCAVQKVDHKLCIMVKNIAVDFFKLGVCEVYMVAGGALIDTRSHLSLYKPH